MLALLLLIACLMLALLLLFLLLLVVPLAPLLLSWNGKLSSLPLLLLLPFLTLLP
jgi:hypothetical protein